MRTTPWVVCCNQLKIGVTVTEKTQPAWDYDVYRYTLDEVGEIKNLLACNGQDIVKVFEIVWRGKFNAIGLLRLIQRIQKGEL